jgi:hypothetical protein
MPFPMAAMAGIQAGMQLGTGIAELIMGRKRKQEEEQQQAKQSKMAQRAKLDEMQAPGGPFQAAGPGFSSIATMLAPAPQSPQLQLDPAFQPAQPLPGAGPAPMVQPQPTPQPGPGVPAPQVPNVQLQPPSQDPRYPSRTYPPPSAPKLNWRF